MAQPDPTLQIFPLARRPAPVGGGRDPLPHLLGCLLSHLERLAAGGGSAEDDGSSDRWEDEGYVYLEAELPAFDGLDVDISVGEGRAFVRVGRRPHLAHRGPDERPARRQAVPVAGGR
jgi:hypothetical protein